MDNYAFDLKNDRLTAATAPEAALWAVLGTDSTALMATNAAGDVLAISGHTYPEANRPFGQTAPAAKQMLRTDTWWDLPYGQKHGFLFHDKVALVPRRLFQHGDLSGYFNLLMAPGDYVYGYEELAEFDAYLVHATEREQADWFTEAFPHARVRHLAAPLLRGVRETAGDAEHTVFVQVRNHVAQIIVLERRNLLFYNTCQFSEAADLLYFVLLAYDQFRLKPEAVPLTVAGHILRDSELYRTLYRFIREVRFAVPPAHFRLPTDAGALPAHCYFDLLCLNKN